ncbi:hypothetical protein BpHYR1_010863 [Brachionus plicatilis]|uniref:Uncharacterized protein n=1 Tax=Brachionus plicatilis TaxID=10195 RepID=A0A3M7RV46_BRAPC|nr:hypothetical protein BpHYR1_010863 [Brachionus plicatilis]
MMCQIFLRYFQTVTDRPIPQNDKLYYIFYHFIRYEYLFLPVLKLILTLIQTGVSKMFLNSIWLIEHNDKMIQFLFFWLF